MSINGYIGLIGLGAIGSPLANLLYEKYRDRFVLLANDEIAEKLKNVYINGKIFNPRIITPFDNINISFDIIFICVKNYSLKNCVDTIFSFVKPNTLLFPLQNGVYSYNFFREKFPNNIILEGFAQGPNTRIFKNNIVYQNPGEYYLGKNNENYKHYAYETYKLLKNANIPCHLEDDIRHSIWKKMMLNVAGNALTALTGLDYVMFNKSTEAKDICNKIMSEFVLIAKTQEITITDEDIQEVFNYFIKYDKSKLTSMLEDVLNNRETENEYIAGYINKLAVDNDIEVPYINTLYQLMKIKEDVYLGHLN